MVGESKADAARSAAVGRTGWLRTVQVQRLARLLAFLILAFVVASAYFSLANDIDDIHDSTAEMRTQAADLERENAAMMLQVAAWNRPDVIAAKAPGLGLVPGGIPVYAQIAAPGVQPQASSRMNDVASWWQQLVLDLARRWSGVTRTAEAPASR